MIIIISFVGMIMSDVVIMLRLNLVLLMGIFSSCGNVMFEVNSVKFILIVVMFVKSMVG